VGPSLSSTVIGEQRKGNTSPQSNGDEHPNGDTSLESPDTETTSSSTHKTPGRRPRAKATSSRGTPRSAVKAEKKGGQASPSSAETTTTTHTSTEADSDVKVKLEPDEEERNRTSIARGKGFATKKAVADFDDPEYVKSETIWTAVGPGIQYSKNKHAFLICIILTTYSDLIPNLTCLNFL
jgi:hypothetical protein